MPSANSHHHATNGVSAPEHHLKHHNAPPSVAARTPLSSARQPSATHNNSHHHPTSSAGSVPPVPAQKQTVIHGYVGFANIPNQVYRKAIKKGFQFTLMVVGQSGLGKSTFVNSLFLSDVYNESERSSKNVNVLEKTVQVEETTVRLEENGVNLTLTLVDTPGFGDAVDNSNCWDPVMEYIDAKYSDYFTEETKINRSTTIPDKRVHICLYFIAPTGHGLKALDIEFMKRVHDRVNIIPVIAKADTLTKEECERFKKTILREIKQHDIRIYDFPEGDDEEDNRVHRALKDRVPFAVVGSNLVCDIDGRKARCRKYQWGVVEVENLEHNDFVALRNMLIRTHMIDLIDVTKCVHFENFRCRQLMSVNADRFKDEDTDVDPFIQMDDEKKKHSQKIRTMEAEMEAVFQQKVNEKKAMLADIERNLEKQREQNRIQMETKRNEIEEKRKRLDGERNSFSSENPTFARYISTDSLPGKDKKKKHGLF